MLIDLKVQDRLREDEFGLVCLINDHWQRHAHAFGDDATRGRIKSQLDQSLAQLGKKHSARRVERDVNGKFVEGLFRAVVEVCGQNGVSPFSELSLVFLGDGYKGKPTLDRAAPFLDSLNSFHSLSGPRQWLALRNAAELIPGKVDYIVTGNAINDPHNHAGDDTMLACGSRLKEGGAAVHLLAYGENSPTGRPYDDFTYRVAGQEIAAIFPAEGGGVRAIVAPQLRDVDLPPQALQWTRRHHPRLWSVYPQTLACQQGEPQPLGIAQFVGHLADHPPLLRHLGFPDWDHLSREPKRTPQLDQLLAELPKDLPPSWVAAREPGERSRT